MSPMGISSRSLLSLEATLVNTGELHHVTKLERPENR